ncbi:hypothetical protein tb265_18430 [Gemmatimonadetes bacterium T265]|nr:hypothetical protein tb265_18430 [Gemmatimonadetes bacterium T265]
MTAPSAPASRATDAGARPVVTPAAEAQIAERARWIGPALAIVLFALALVVLQRELRAYRFGDVLRAFHAIPAAQLGTALAFTALSYAVLPGYDALALAYVRRSLPLRRVAFASFLSYAISHTLGFPVLTGGAVRVRFWSAWGLSTGEIAQAVSFAGFAFTLGMVLMAGVVFVAAPAEMTRLLHLPFASLRPAGVVLLAVVAAYVAWSVVTAARGGPAAPAYGRRAGDAVRAGAATGDGADCAAVDAAHADGPALVASPTAGAGLTPVFPVRSAGADAAADADASVLSDTTPLALAAVAAERPAGRRDARGRASTTGRVRIGGWAFPIPAPRLALSQLVLAAVDWTVAGVVLWSLLPHGGAPGAVPDAVPFLPFLGAFLLAQFAGVLSHVPGGLGVFESLLVLLLGRYVPGATVLGALFAYRAVYYLLPFATAVAAFGLYETRYVTQRGALAAVRGARSGARVVGRVGPAVVPAALSFATFAAGAVLLVSGSTPSLHARVAVLHTQLPLGVIELSHLAASLAGAALLVVAWALRRRLDAAWGLAAALLGVGIVGSLLKGLDYEEATILALVLAALLPSRKAFYRKAALMSESFTPGWTVAVALVLGISLWLGFFSYKHVEYSNDLWWRFTARGDAPRFLRATVGAAGGLLLFGLARLLRHAPAEPDPPAPADVERAAAVVRTAPNTEANLALLGDKSLLFSASGNAFVMYGVAGRSWVALGDPVGPVDEHAELAWAFKEAADEHGGWPVFYQISVDHLPLYIDLGLTLLKLGEEARIPLDRFSLDGGARKSMRRIVNAVDKTGARFEVVGPEAVPALLPELRRVSDAWLASKRVREKGFSLGYFDEAYLRHFPLALVRAPRRDGGDRTGEEIVAFANLWTGAGKHELSMDLMRYAPEAPESVMEYLFLQLMLWGKAQGYAEFNLGMAPLSGFESRSLAPLWIRAGALVYQHGENFYNFQGLRRYKEKFDPVWEPRYLASPGGLALPRILANVTALISGGLKGVVAR